MANTKINPIKNYEKLQSFISNGAAEFNTTGWATYADAAASRPVDGTGGSPSVTFTRSLTSPISDSASFIFTKGASDLQGQGVSYAFTIDAGSQAKVLNINFKYLVDSGTYTAGGPSTDSDLIVYLYDVTNAVLIEPSSIKTLSNSSTIADRFSASFQTASNSTSYRLIFHVATTSASAWALKIDDVSVSLSNYTYGTPITDWQAYNLVIGAVTTPPTQGAGATKTAFWRRVGDSMEIEFTYAQTAAGTAGTGAYLYTLPSGYSMDINKITMSTGAIGAGGTVVGIGQIGNTASAGATSTGFISVIPYNTTNLTLISYTSTAGHLNQNSSSHYALNGNPIYISFKATVPILGWSSSVQMSDSADTRIVDFRANKTATQAITALVTNIAYPTVIKDSHGGWNASTNEYTVIVPGDYLVSTTLSDSASTGNTHIIYINGIISTSLFFQSGQANSGTALMTGLVAGNTISIRGSNNATLAAVGSLSINRLAGPSAIAATEYIGCRYSNSAGTAVSTSTTIMPFPTKSFDTHGAYNTSTGVFTVPAAGKYRVISRFTTANVNLSTVQGVDIRLFKNTVVYSELGEWLGNGVSNAQRAGGTDVVECIAGDTLDVRVTSSVATTLLTNGIYNYLVIERVG